MSYKFFNALLIIRRAGGSLRTSFLVGLSLSLLCAACADRKNAERQYLLRDLPPDMIRNLMSSDDSAFARYGREVGIVVMLDAGKKLDERLCGMFIDGRETEVPPLITYYKRVARVLSDEYHYGLYHDRLIFIENLPPEIRLSLLRRESDFYSFRSEIHLPPEEKIERYSAYLEAFQGDGDLLFAALCEYELSYAYGAIGDERERLKYLRDACRDFAGCGLHEMTCPTLCELGSYYEGIGHVDSMVVFFEEAERIARRSRLPWEAAQISSLYAAHYARHGRLSLAYDLLSDAIELCREYRGEYSELEFIVEMMIFQAEIGCWEIVERLIERARVLQDKYENHSQKYIKLYAIQIDRIEARMWMARGDVEKAESIFRRTEKAIDDLVMPYTQEPEKAELFMHWSEGLLENGRPYDALEIIREGSWLSGEVNLPGFPARFALLEAEAAFRLDDMHRFGQALRRFEDLAGEDGQTLQREWIGREALVIEAKLRAGERDAAIHALAEGLTRLERYVGGMDASVQSYLWIGELEKLHLVMHDVIAHDPALGYGAELYWRDFFRLLGRRTRMRGGADSMRARTAAAGTVPRAPDTAGAIIDVFRGRTRTAAGRIGDAGAVHGLYLVHGDEIWRWTVSPEGVHRETLDASADEVLQYVTGAWNAMSRDYAPPDTIPLAALRGTLRALARILLPPEIMDVPSTPSEQPFLITTDGFLGLIPFETFDIGKGNEYTPLLMHRDVAYLRYMEGAAGPRAPAGANAPVSPQAIDAPQVPADPHVSAGPRAPAGGAQELPGVILVNAEPSKELMKRYPFQPELEEVMAEGETVASLNPGARFLAGDSATKLNLLSVWENASFIYMAAHMLRDPQVPYLMLIPLASPGESSGPDAAYLDVTDIRAADFGACRIVILSGCSSGSPYLEARIAGPSLGDAFLDAGAGAVVHTFWDVLDLDARRLMTSYIQAWGDAGPSGIHSLCGVRRRAFQSSGEARHPFGWAVYSIKVGRL